MHRNNTNVREKEAVDGLACVGVCRIIYDKITTFVNIKT